MTENWTAVSTTSKETSAVTLDALVGPTWKLVSINGKNVVDKSNVSMILGAGGKVAGNTGVNRFSGMAEIKGKEISFGPLATTRRAGPPALMAQECMFLTAMLDVGAMNLAVDGILNFVNANDVAILTFAANQSEY